jgi:Family of unknown function (DUF6343)
MAERDGSGRDSAGGIGGAAPARSALTLRLVLASLGFVSCGVGAVVLAIAGRQLVIAAVLGLFALVAVVDIAVIVRRKRSGDSG